MIKPLEKKHASQVAQLHIDGISTGFISSLGLRFVTALYESIVKSSVGFGFVEELDGRVVGFVSFTTDLKGLYRTIIKKNLFRFGLILIAKLFSIKTIKKIFETLFYPSRAEISDLPDAELLSIVIAESERGKGTARSLIQHGLEKCRNRDIEKVKVLVADFNKPANSLYQKVGFECVAQLENHGIVSNVYVIPTDHFTKSQ